MKFATNSKTPGRNDPCPCGSGKKYKKCCLGKLGDSPANVNEIGEMVANASSEFERGNFLRSKELVDRVLDVSPNNRDAIYILGLLEMQFGNLEESERLLLKAQKKSPGNQYIVLNLAKLYKQKNSFTKSLAAARKAFQLDSNNADIQNTLGGILLKLEKFEEAQNYFEKAVELEPDNPAYQLSYYAGLHHQEKINDALEGYKKLIKSFPEYIDAYINLSAIYRDQGDFERSADILKDAIRISGGSAELYNNLGTILSLLGRYEEEIECYENALKLNSSHLTAYRNLMGSLVTLNHVDKALHYSRAILQNPNCKELIPFVIGIFGKVGLFAERNEVVNSIIKQTYDDNTSCNSIAPLLLNLSYVDNLDAKSIYHAHRCWAQSLEKEIANEVYSYSFDNHVLNQKLKIGYLSPDFRKHPVGFFFTNLITNFNHDDYDIYCYYNFPIVDEITENIKNNSTIFRQVDKFSGREIAKIIHDDNIDILIDLGGHTSNSGVSSLALKPAPVQMTYLGYPNTTGLTAVDYRITDRFADVEGGTIYSEEKVYVPECFLSFGEFPDIDINPEPPVTRNGHITFASFNNILKLNNTTIEYFSRVLNAVENSRFLIKARELDTEIAQQNILNSFNKFGIKEDRILLQATTVSIEEHMNLYNSVDIALDSYPYNGTTTTCEALWMGVPVITLTGMLHPSRVSYSILKNLGLEGFSATDVDSYVEIASNLTKDINELRRLRHELRSMMKDSILCKPEILAGHLESLYKEVWEKYRKHGH